MSEDPSATPAPVHYDSVLTNTSRIRSLLEYCLGQEERLELELEGKVRLFYTVLLSHPADETVGNAVAPAKTSSPTSDSGYLSAGTHLTLAPLFPPIGNMILKKLVDPKGILRFFKGLRAYEATTTFLRIGEVDGESVLIFSYPTELGVLNKRRHYRMRVPEGFPIVASVTIDDDPEVKQCPVVVCDVSVGGLAFMHQLPGDKFAIDQVVKLVVRVPGVVYLRIIGYVRSQVQKNTREVRVDGIATRLVCGVQFDLQDMVLEKHINELVAHLQLLQLADMNEDDDLPAMRGVLHFKDKHAPPPPPPEVKIARPKLPERVSREEAPAKEKKESGWLKGLLGGEKPPVPDKPEKKPALDLVLEMKRKNAHKVQ